MDHQQPSRWPPTRGQVLWTGGVVACLAVSILISYRYGITLWDWLKLLIVPAVIAGGGIWFNRQQRERELEIAREQRERDIKIADERAQDEALQAYFDQIGQLLLDKDRPLRQSKPHSVHCACSSCCSDKLPIGLWRRLYLGRSGPRRASFLSAIRRR